MPSTFVTTTEQRAGVFVAVISGGRPTLRQRPTSRYLPSLDTAGTAGIAWFVREDEADGYERDQYPVLTYSRDWAYEYARTHWMLDTPAPRDGWWGSAVPREWATREAERRGCWAVLHLDDNIDWLCFLRGTQISTFIPDRGGLALYLDLFLGVLASTNARLVGAQLAAVTPDLKQAATVARPGFAYSLYAERVGPGREEYFGPYEDDIIHALLYGQRGDGATSAVMPSLAYHKNYVDRVGGNRPHYGPTVPRAVPLQRAFPQAADIKLRRTHANGRGDHPRVFHSMPRGAIRNPLVVRDPILYGKVRDRMQTLISEWWAGEITANRQKAARRGRQAARMRQART